MPRRRYFLNIINNGIIYNVITKTTPLKAWQQSRITLSVLCLIFIISGCSLGKSTDQMSVSGGRSALQTIDVIINHAPPPAVARSAAMLGVFISEYIATSAAAQGVEGALLAVGVQSHIMETQGNVSDPDFDLMQAFADALQVDVADLLNRSPDRQQALDTYSTALTNVASKANDRYKQVIAATDEVKTQNRDDQSAKNSAERELKKALNDKAFNEASTKQKKLLETQQALAESDLKLRELTELSRTLDKLLTLYGQKILAIQQNREILISGLKVVDVPGIEELKIIQRTSGNGLGTSRTNPNAFDTLFQGTNN